MKLFFALVNYGILSATPSGVVGLTAALGTSKKFMFLSTGLMSSSSSIEFNSIARSCSVMTP